MADESFTELYTIHFGGEPLEWDEELAHGVVVGLMDEFDLWRLTSLQRRLGAGLLTDRGALDRMKDEQNRLVYPEPDNADGRAWARRMLRAALNAS